jgi:hypothetical protein
MIKRIHACGQFWVTTADKPGVHLQVFGFPAPLLAGPFPNRHQPDWFTLKKAGIRQIVCLASTTPDLRYDPYPGGLSWLAKVDMPELADYLEPGGPDVNLLRALGSFPEDAAYKSRKASRTTMKSIAKDVLAALYKQDGVFLHCQYGVERTGLLIALLLEMVSGDREQAADAVARCLSPHSGDGSDLQKRLQNAISASSLET